MEDSFVKKKIWYSFLNNEKYIEHVLFSKKVFSEDLRIDIKQNWAISATPTSADKVGSFFTRFFFGKVL